MHDSEVSAFDPHTEHFSGVYATRRRDVAGRPRWQVLVEDETGVRGFMTGSPGEDFDVVLDAAVLDLRRQQRSVRTVPALAEMAVA